VRGDRLGKSERERRVRIAAGLDRRRCSIRDYRNADPDDQRADDSPKHRTHLVSQAHLTLTTKDPSTNNQSLAPHV
jgi:hypothetical protein